ncbi:MAG: hypothetical protein LBC73_09490 [Oscillospiraceae bacterium]|nr:hypothetical protein [Oscillospiraceae bacterium]
MHKKTIFFGAGNIGEWSLQLKPQDLVVYCFIDNDSDKWGTELHGIEINSPQLLEELSEDIEIIITVANKLQYEIVSQIEKYDFVYGRDIFTYDEKLLYGVINILPYDDSINSNSDNEKVIPRHLKEYITTHKVIPLSYAIEWTPLMYKDCCLFMTEFLTELAKSSYGLDNLMIMNITFYKGKFMYLDIDGLCSYGMNGLTTQRFIDMFVNPLILILKQPIKWYISLKNPMVLIKYKDIVGYLSEEENNYYLQIQQACYEAVKSSNFVECYKLWMDYMVSMIKKHNVFTNNTHAYLDYQDNLYKDLDESIISSQKQLIIFTWIDKIKPNTVIDLAGNAGYYCIANAKKLDYAIVADISITAIEKAYIYVVQKKIRNVLPVCFNIMHQLIVDNTNPFIPNLAYLSFKSIHVRFKCDLVLLLAVLHHLTLGQGFTFVDVLDKISPYINKYLIIEYMDLNDFAYAKNIKNFSKDKLLLYTKESFLSALKRTFIIIDTASSNIETRTLYLCEKL